MSVLVIFLKR